MMFAGSVLFFINDAEAQMMMGGGRAGVAVDWDEIVEHTAREEQEGLELWSKLQAKEITCTSLGDEQFGVLGEYYMGQMMGESHAAMNAMMVQAHGEEGEEQIHIALGKRLSGCDPSASALGGMGNFGGWMPMMQTWGGGGPGYFAHARAGGLGWLLMILWWVLVIFGVVSLVKWLAGHGQVPGGSALEVLKSRYAKGEINKDEFESKKKDLV